MQKWNNKLEQGTRMSKPHTQLYEVMSAMTSSCLHEPLMCRVL